MQSKVTERQNRDEKHGPVLHRNQRLPRAFAVALSLLLIITIAFALTACGTQTGAGGANGSSSNAGANHASNAGTNAETGAANNAAIFGDTGEGSKKIIATIFPEFDWLREIIGEDASGVQVRLLLHSGVDMHSYQPTVEDIAQISKCDMLVYVGGESDAWIEDAIKEAINPDVVTVNLMEILGDAVHEEETVEGMQEAGIHFAGNTDINKNKSEKEETASEGEENEKQNDEEKELDEHVWLSLRNAELFTGAIAEALTKVNPESATDYLNNASAYQQRLAAMDESYKEAIAAAPLKTLLFADRFPFRYLVEDYELNYYAAFVGCSAETEASFETILFLVKKVDELHLPCVLILEGSSKKLAETIIQSTTEKNQKILTLDSMQSVNLDNIQNGVTYLSIMEDNLNVIYEALGGK